MSGVGVITLAGIVVNNNIVFIDTYNVLRGRGAEAFEAILRTCAVRLRPVLLTTVTTILGLMPMVFALNIDLINRDVSVGAPATQYWTQLSSGGSGRPGVCNYPDAVTDAQLADDPGQCVGLPLETPLA